MTAQTPHRRTASHDHERTHRCPENRRAAWADVCRLFVCLGLFGTGLVGFSATASAHGSGHGVGHDGAAATFAVVLGLPILAGLVGGIVAIRYRDHRRPEPGNRTSSRAVGLLLVGLGAASLLPAVTGHLWLSVAGGTIGAVIALWVAGSGTVPETGCRNHADLTFGAISAHRVLEGIVLGMLYSTGAAVGLLSAIVLAGHAALETAAVGGLYATASRRIWTVGAIILVQAGYVVGGVAGLGVAGAVPVSIRTLALAIVGGALLIVGASETKRSVTQANWRLPDDT